MSDELEQSIRVDRRGGLVTVTLNRPHRRNALDTAAMDQLGTVLREVGTGFRDRALVLTGAGGSFCSGQDLGPADFEIAEEISELRYVRRVGEVLRRLHDLEIPTVARVDGIAYGLGWCLALACDLVVASRDARFCMIFARRGLTLDSGASWLLPRLIGLQRAKQLSFLAEAVSAEQAEALGLVTRVVDPGDLDKAVEDWARRLATGPTIAHSLSKAMLNRSFATSFDQALEDEARSQHVTLTTQDARLAIEAFRVKREPDFTGR
jgi:2-(1,2-epoxy-1,2-dihydrophenyl)acetyl-CoA isomerase